MSTSLEKNHEDAAETDALPLLDAPVAAPAPPRVNLLPPEIAEQRAIRRLAMALAATVAVCGVAVGGAYVYAGQGEAQARSDLASAQAVQSNLQSRQTALLPAQQAQTQLLAAQRALAAAMGNEVLWSRYLDQLRLQRPEGVRFSSVGLAPAGGTGSTSTGPAPGAAASASSGAASSTSPGAIATLTISGKARSQPDVASLLDQLAKIHGFTGVYLSSTSGDSSASVITYTVTAGVTAEALSHRYTVEGQ